MQLSHVTAWLERQPVLSEQKAPECHSLFKWEKSLFARLSYCPDRKSLVEQTLVIRGAEIILRQDM